MQIKSTFMGTEKALIIKLNPQNHADNKSLSLYEQISHLYVMTEHDLDKYILLFSFVKLAILQGKTVIMCNDVIEAYRIKLFLNKFSLKAFVLAPEMPRN